MADAEESDYEEEADEDITVLVSDAYRKAKKAEEDEDQEGSLDNPLMAKLVRRKKEEASKKEALKDAKKKKQDEMEKKSEEKQRRRWEKNYTSEDSLIKSDQTELNTYYCSHCGAYSLIVDVPLEVMPKRKTDGSTVLDEKRRTFHRMMVKGPLRVLKRNDGIERQYRLLCKECKLPLCYRTVPVERKSKYCYIIKDALVDKPNEVKQAEELEAQQSAVLPTSVAIKQKLALIEKLVEEHKDVLPEDPEDENEPAPSVSSSSTSSSSASSSSSSSSSSTSSKFQPLFPAGRSTTEKQKIGDKSPKREKDKSPKREKSDKSPKREKKSKKSRSRSNSRGKKRSRSRSPRR